MPLDPIADLLARVTRGGEWPPKSEVKAWAKVDRGRAFAESDRAELARIALWKDRTRPYRVDPLPDRIREAWADHLFGEDLTVTTGVEGNTDALERIVAENDLTEEVRHAVRDYQVPEGEAWWRIFVDREVAEVPLIEWLSRRTIAPFYIGRRLLAAAYITELEGRANVRSNDGARWRLFECHADERVELHLYRGTDRRLGARMSLDSHTETEELADSLIELESGGAVWEHGQPMLMGRVVNKRGRDARLGVGEFIAIEDLLLKLNEAVSIGWENMRLTAKRRVVVPASSVQPQTSSLPTGDELIDVGDGSLVPANGRALFDAGEDVLIADPVDSELGRETQPPFKVLEYSYDAEPLIADKRDTVETILTRLGLTPQWVGVVTNANDGFAASGTALRLRLIPTDKAGRGRGRAWDRELPRILGLALAVAALPEQDGGLDLDVADPEEEPTVTRANPLPRDEVEEATIESTLVSAGVRSVETSVRAQHSEWGDEEVDAELARIKADRPAATVPTGF